MGNRSLEIIEISIELKNIGSSSKVLVIAMISGSAISGDSQNQEKLVDKVNKDGSDFDKDGGSHSSRDFTMKFTVDEMEIRENRLNLVFQLRYDRKVLGDKDIWQVHVPVKELLGKAAGYNKPAVPVEYPVRNPFGEDEGTLKFSFKFGRVCETHAGHENPPVQQQSAGLVVLVIKGYHRVDKLGHSGGLTGHENPPVQQQSAGLVAPVIEGYHLVDKLGHFGGQTGHENPLVQQQSEGLVVSVIKGYCRVDKLGHSGGQTGKSSFEFDSSTK